MKKKTTIEMNELLHHGFKVACAANNTTMSDKMREWVHDYVTEYANQDREAVVN